MTTADDVRKWRAAMTNLPTAEDFARPLVETIHALHLLQDVTAAAERLSDGGECVDDVGRLVRFIEDVAGYAECAVNNCIPHAEVDRDLATAMRRIVLDVSGGDHVRTSFHRNHLTPEWYR